jgi:hypothetical protein
MALPPRRATSLGLIDFGPSLQMPLAFGRASAWRSQWRSRIRKRILLIQEEPVYPVIRRQWTAADVLAATLPRPGDHGGTRLPGWADIGHPMSTVRSVSLGMGVPVLHESASGEICTVARANGRISLSGLRAERDGLYLHKARGRVLIAPPLAIDVRSTPPRGGRS